MSGRPFSSRFFRQVILSLTLLVGIVVIGAGCRAADGRKGEKTVIEQQVMEMMNKLDTLDDRARMKVLSHVDEQRNELLGVLLKHLGTSSSKDVQAAAIYLIGRHRLSEGVSDLIRRIDLDTGERGLAKSLPLWDRYPAMEALITIGRPSVLPAVEVLATETNDLRRDLAVKVVRYAEDAGVAKFILERALSAEKDPNRVAKLKDALSRLDRLIQATK